MSSSLVLHGVPLSQPFRSVAWACVMKQLPFKVQLAVPGSSDKLGSKSAAFLHLSPPGAVPVLQHGNLTLSESAAILEYLAATHAWTDLLPADPAGRAAVSEAMHWHHGGTRQLSAWFAEKVRPDLVGAVGEAAAAARKARGLEALGLLERWQLGSSPFLAGRTSASIADLLVYEDVGPLGKRFANLVDLQAYPKVASWCARMEALAGFEESHAAIAVLGDLSQSTTVSGRQLGDATKAGLKALAAAQAGQSSKL
ncbi:hypothetical protein AB1Y20_018344 [Prymnesium parvum]|uniref:Glutathione transferase n=1 Tax=Prymnesium parvum TaxID=97485 RepID=A0AB34JRE9_PRYPA